MTFQGRAIDLRPFLEGYPYAPVLPVWDEGALLFDHKAASRVLKRTALDTPDLTAGEPVVDVDWNARSRWGLEWHAPSRGALLTADERNDEVMNLYWLGLDTGELKRLTDEPYVYGYALSDAKDELIVIPRRGDGPYTSCLERMPPTGGARTTVLCDTPDATLTWSSPVWAPDARGVVTEVAVAGRRDRANLAWVAFDDPKLTLLLDPAVTRSTAYALQPWLDPNRFLLVADDGGFAQLGVYDLSNGELRWLTAFTRELTTARLLRAGVLAVLHDPIRDSVLLLDPETGAERSRLDVDGTVSVLGHDDVDSAAISVTSAASPFSARRLEVADGVLTERPWLDLPEDVASSTVHCDVSAVAYETFDGRQLHAFLYTPKVPLDPPAARVKSFYGGDNAFDVETQIFCAAGIATFSPAVRGSHGFGSDFARLNDGDLGGDELIDVFRAARWLVSQGYPEDRIGVYGRSHGGYATMRAMTYPPGDEVFPFAFGMSDAGFADIPYFWEHCNIPDWVVTEAGTDAEQLLDRSPVTHVDRLNAPLFLTHGTNDQRVPVEGSRAMARRCEELGKSCTYVEFPDQGHRVGGLENTRKLYQARFAFLEQVLQ